MRTQVQSKAIALGTIAVILTGVVGCGGSSDAKSFCLQHATTGPDIASPNFDAEAADFFDWADGVKTTDDTLNGLLEAEVSAGREMLQQGSMTSFNAWADTAIAVDRRCNKVLNSN